MHQIDREESDGEAKGVKRREVVQESVASGGHEGREHNQPAAKQQHAQNSIQSQQDGVIQPAARCGELGWTQRSKRLDEGE
jgi:hypothetical protein